MNEGCLDKNEVNELIFKEFIKNGYAGDNEHRVWDIAERRFLYLTPEQAKSFLKLNEYKVYKKQIIDRELSVLKEHGNRITENIGNEPFNLVDIFCGDGEKAVEFIKLLVGKNNNLKIRYCPINVCSYLTDKAIETMKNAGFKNIVDYKPMLAQGDGRSLRYLDKSLKSKEFSKNVILILGTVLASYDINEYLFEMNKDMAKDDILIIGNGIRTGERLVEIEKYKDKAMSDWIVHVVRGLGLSDEDIEYDVRFGNKRVEMFYKVKNDRTIEHDGKEVRFKKGDEILAFYLYKYYEKEFDKFCRMYFPDTWVVTDRDKGYALAVCKK